MSHNTLIGGTSYEITGGRTLVDGTGYDVTSGRTLIGGTGYDISFGAREPVYAVLYTDYSLVFQNNSSAISGKTMKACYENVENTNYTTLNTIPWYNYKNDLTSVTFDTEIRPISISYWFYDSRKISINLNNFSNLNLSETTSMHHTFYFAGEKSYGFIGSPICGDKITDMSTAYYYGKNLSGNPVCGNNVINMSQAYSLCWNLTGPPVCGNKVENMHGTYSTCYRITGSPVCGTNVVDFSFAYSECYNLTGAPVCGSKVTNMSNTYYWCRNLTGAPVCGSNVTNMYGTYAGCSGLTGSPVCGSKVTSMAYTYYDCYKLTGSPVCKNKVTNVAYAYYSCKNIIKGTIKWYAKNITNACNCFGNKNVFVKFNIYVVANSKTLNTFLINNTKSIVGKNITWTQDGTKYYNTAYNIYIYATL